ncbi:hypothetical protein EYC84_007563 [Monilinia fructicola]|uniref:Uncharacterized protein n=1 Tax=Monilinia fructicola TaxID=38448 RepID=A0A5M9JJK4_MONFR|nr:hypothetical protein EYC84_007563 [Monilinia fructicola]
MHHNNAHPAKRRKYLLSTPGPSDEVINDLLMDFKDTQLRQVIDVSMKGGDVRRSIRYIHARLPEKLPNEDQLDVLATSSVLDADKVIQSIEISPMPERRFFPMPAPQPNRQPPTQSSPVEHKDILSHNATQSLVYLPKLANNGNLLTPRSSTELFRKEVQNHVFSSSNVPLTNIFPDPNDSRTIFNPRARPRRSSSISSKF